MGPSQWAMGLSLFIPSHLISRDIVWRKRREAFGPQAPPPRGRPSERGRSEGKPCGDGGHTGLLCCRRRRLPHLGADGQQCGRDGNGRPASCSPLNGRLKRLVDVLSVHQRGPCLWRLLGRRQCE